MTRRFSEQRGLLLSLYLLVLTGFSITFDHSWSRFQFYNLWLHQAIGLLSLVLIVLCALRAPQFQLPIGGGQRSVLLFPVALAVLFGLVSFADPGRPLFLAQLIVLVIVLAASGWWTAIRKPGEGPWLPIYACFGLWTLTLFTGIAIIILYQRGGVKYVFQAHLATAILFVPTAFGAAASMLRRHRAVIPAAGRPWTLLATAVTLVYGVHLAGGSLHRDPQFTVHLSTIPLERRAPEERQTRFGAPSLAPAAMDLTDGCTDAPGCHGNLKKGFLDSNHNISLMSPHFQKNLDLLSEELGPANVAICAGCHFPAGLFDPARDQRHFASNNNFSCSFCHVIESVTIVDARRSNYTLKPPVRQLALFVEARKPLGLSRAAALQIKLSPLTHGREFTRRLYFEDPYCLVCHHHQLRLADRERIMRPRCIECHMQPQQELGLPGSVRNHFMPGVNLSVPQFAGRDDATELIRRWATGEHVLRLGGWQNLWQFREDRSQPVIKVPWLLLALDAAKPTAGQEFRFKVVTTNVGMEHPFPAGPFDLVDAWLEVRVVDQQGRPVFSSGGIDENGDRDPRASRLGGGMYDSHDNAIRYNRVWAVAKKVTDRVIGPSDRVVDEFVFPAPADATELRIAAQWNYRKLNADFCRWAYGQGTEIPTVALGRVERTIAVGAATPQRRAARGDATTARNDAGQAP